MASNLSDEAWGAFVADVAKKLSVADAQTYPRPEPGSTAFNKTVDHTLLKLGATEKQIDELCEEAKSDNFATVCVRPKFVQRCTNNLKGTNVGVACVIGFHEGTYDLQHKASETKTALEGGASELDLVINYPELKKGKYANIYEELKAIREQAPPPVLIKLIIETSQLDRSEIIAACALAAEAGMDYVKTSTGFNGPGASVENVRLMKAVSELTRGERTNSPKMLVKASGGVRSLEDAIKMLEAGASRLGTSGGVTIAKEGREHASGSGVKQSQKMENTSSVSDY